MAKRLRYKQTGCRMDTILNQVWMCDPHRLHAWVEQAWIIVERNELQLHMEKSQEISEEREKEPYVIENGVARVLVAGPMMKYENSFMSLFGGTSTIALAHDLRTMVADPKVKAIFMEIDSPGGTADGTAEMASVIRQIDKKKRIIVRAPDMACSAALWIATQGSALTCGPTAQVGSLGTKAVLYDRSKSADGAKVKPLVFTTGEFKAIGEEGQEFTQAHKDEIQRIVNKVNAPFLAEVTSARKLTDQQVADVKTARVYVGQEAVDIGLCDHVCSNDEAFEEVVKMVKDGGGPVLHPNRTTVVMKTGSKKMALTDNQLQQARTIPGCEGITNDNADHLLLNAAQTAARQVTELRQQVPQRLDETTARIRAQAYVDRIGFLERSGKITSAQAKAWTAMFMKDNKPVIGMVTPNTDGSMPADAFFDLMNMNEPNKITEQQSGAQVAPRTIDGGNGNGLGQQQKVTLQQFNATREAYGLSPMSADEFAKATGSN